MMPRGKRREFWGGFFNGQQVYTGIPRYTYSATRDHFDLKDIGTHIVYIHIWVT